MGAMKDLATTLGIDYAEHVNRIRYPKPNTLDLGRTAAERRIQRALIARAHGVH